MKRRKPPIRFQIEGQERIRLTAPEGSWYFNYFVEPDTASTLPLVNWRPAIVHMFEPEIRDEKPTGRVICWDVRWPDEPWLVTEAFQDPARHIQHYGVIDKLVERLKRESRNCYEIMRGKRTPPHGSVQPDSRPPEVKSGGVINPELTPTIPAPAGLPDVPPEIEGYLRETPKETAPVKPRKSEFELVGTGEAKLPYEKNEAINASSLKLIHKSPLHFWQEYRNPDRIKPEPTPSMQMGTALHSLVLEGTVNWAVVPAEINRRTKVGRQEYEAWLASLKEGTPILKPDQAAQIQEMAEAILTANTLAKDLIQEAFTEVPLTWDLLWDPHVIPCKGRIDGFKEGSQDLSDPTYIFDIKTTTDASPEGFARAIYNYSYHIQAAFYVDGVYANRTVDIQVEDIPFYFIAVETKPPYAVAVHALAIEAIQQGRRTYRKAIQTFIDCVMDENGLVGTSPKSAWPSYPNSPGLQLPRYAWDAVMYQQMTD